MNKKIIACLALMLFTMSFGLSSCSEESEKTVEEYPDWENTNTTYFNTLYQQVVSSVAAGDTTWKVFKNYSFAADVHNDAADHIVVKVQNEGTGTVSPLYTDSVEVHYQGRLLPSTSYPAGYVFDQSWVQGYDYDLNTMVPMKFLVSDLTDGFATALQHMHLGDRWTVYVPYQLGYGTTATSSVPAYSTLIFDITLVGIYRAGQVVPTFRSTGTALVTGWLR